MDSAELEQYEYQLSQIKLALAKDPTNSEYLNLKEELSSLIQLTKEYLSSAAPPPPAPKPSRPEASTSAPRPPRPSAPAAAPTPPHSLKSGDNCLARYEGDSKFYPARITSVGGSDENRVYSIIFSGYESTEIVSHADIKPLSESKKRAIQLSEEDLEKERKKKKNEKKADTMKVKTQEQGERQKSWQSFAKKSTKKGVVIPGLAGLSQFRSPEDLNPNAKVGVVGSGKGMKPAVEKKRQTFREGGDE